MELSTELIIFCLISFLSGSIPTGVIVSRTFFGFDIRTKGSGNMGSTNVFRVLGTKWGIVVQVIDILKGFLPVYIISNFYASQDLIDTFFIENATTLKLALGLLAILGHIFSPFVSFKGGKGINTATGILIAISPIDIGVAFVVFWLVVFSTGYISLGSLSAGFILPITLFFRNTFLNSISDDYLTLLIFFTLIFLIIILTHKENIKRLKAGKENKFEKLHLFKKK
jgi:glycerol-3-phosphate acyltransferase PlsY